MNFDFFEYRKKLIEIKEFSRIQNFKRRKL